MPKYKLFLPETEQTLYAREGQTIRSILTTAGITLDYPCGGTGRCQGCMVWIRKTGEGAYQKVRSCVTQIHSDLELITKKNRDETHVSMSPVHEEKNGDYVLIDVGTTSITIARASEKCLFEKIEYRNPLHSLGMDTISILGKVQKDEARYKAHQRLLQNIRERIEELQAGVNERFKKIIFCANTGMMSILENVPSRSLIRPPFEIASDVFELSGALKSYFSDFADEILRLPGIGGFVGSDSSACLLSGGFEKEEHKILLDIGTNTEILLKHNDKIFCCSAPSGPAFEGAEISCGIRAVEGAVDNISLEGGELKMSVIGGGEARGLCGSGLLSLTTLLLKEGILGADGKFTKNANSPLVKQLVESSSGTVFQVNHTVFLSQKDVRALQLAKSSILAGLKTLLDRAGASEGESFTLVLTGSFGSHMNPSVLMDLHFLPDTIQIEKTVRLTDGAIKGERMFLTEEERLKRLLSSCTHINLSQSPFYQTAFFQSFSF